jgi:hypothetical protein
MDEFLIIRQMTFNSFCSIFQARNLATDQFVCIKKINFHNDDQFLKKIQTEAIFYTFFHIRA